MKKGLLTASIFCGCSLVSLFLYGYSRPASAKEKAFVQGATAVPHRDEMLNDNLQPKDSVRLEAFQRASRIGDSSQVSAMVAALDHPSHSSDMYVLPRLLARMGATPALPILDQYIADRPGSLLSNMARVAKFRLLAENDVRSSADDKTKSSQKIRLFLHGIALTPADLNVALTAYQSPEIDEQGRKIVRSEGREAPIGVMAVDEIADIVYSGSSQDYLDLPEVSQINFQSYYPAFLKMRLAPYKHQQRIAMMIDDLSAHTVLKGEDNYEIQLLADEGEAASVPIADKLRQMRLERSKFRGAGFAALFSALACADDTRQLALVRSFEDDQDPTVANSAILASQSLESRTKRFAVLGY